MVLTKVRMQHEGGEVREGWMFLDPSVTAGQVLHLEDGFWLIEEVYRDRQFAAEPTVINGKHVIKLETQPVTSGM